MKIQRRTKRIILICLGSFFVLLAIFVAALLYWYQTQLQPVSLESDAQKASIVIKEGQSTFDVAKNLADKKVIRNAYAFEIYLRLNKKTSIKAGTCIISSSEFAESIADKLNKGCHDFKAITFYPGGTLESSLYKSSRSNDGVDKTSARYILQQSGYSDKDIDQAFAAKYDSPLFSDKPADASLEGYIFGETYYVSKDATAEEVLRAVFDHMYKVVQKHDLVNKYKAQGLTLYQGLILSSIVERELSCEDKPTPERKERCYQYQRGIAQVFIRRYQIGMQLGSDITAVYAADDKKITIPKNDVSTLLSVDSPYNTRKYVGLPPTPIAAPGELSLRSVANPTETENLFFLAGDDGLIYFAKTDQEHQANIVKHCKILCNII